MQNDDAAVRYSKVLDMGRNVGDLFWNRVEPYQQVAISYEKLDVSFLAFVQVAPVAVVLSHP